MWPPHFVAVHKKDSLLFLALVLVGSYMSTLPGKVAHVITKKVKKKVKRIEFAVAGVLAATWVAPGATNIDSYAGWVAGQAN